MERLKGWIKKIPLRAWIFLAITILSLLVLEEVVDDVFNDPLEGDLESVEFDDSVTRFVSQFRTPRTTQTMVELTALGSASVVLTLFFILFSVLASYRDIKGLWYLLIVLTGSGIWPLLLKLRFQRPRPSTEQLVPVADLSFPSGHTFAATAVYIALAFYAGQYAKTWKQEIFFYYLAGLLILLVGVSRIYLGVHYPTDVIAGVAGGAAWAFGISFLHCVIGLSNDKRFLKR